MEFENGNQKPYFALIFGLKIAFDIFSEKSEKKCKKSFDNRFGVDIVREAGQTNQTTILLSQSAKNYYDHTRH